MKLKIRRRFRYALSAVVAGLFTALSAAYAFPVTIDPGAYEGRYNPAGQGFRSGISNFDLPAGTHRIDIENAVSLRFNVDHNSRRINIKS